jgi:hypothetical protein
MPARYGFTNHTIGYITLDRSSVKLHREFIRRLTTQQLPKLAKRYFERSPRGAVILARARELIQRLIYDIHPDPGSRTGSLLDSFAVSPDEADELTGALSLFSDPDVAPSKSDPSLSYAAFFEEPEEFETFIEPAGLAEYPVNYRPFFEDLVEMMDDRIGLLGRDAVMTAIFELTPVGMDAKVT